MTITEQITAFLQELLEQEDGMVEFSRGDLAKRFDCAPSVVTYAVQSRFTPALGYRILTKRSRGGGVSITRVAQTHFELVEKVMENIGNDLEFNAALALAAALEPHFGESVADMLRAAISAPALRRIPPDLRGGIRADILRQMIAHLA